MAAAARTGFRHIILSLAAPYPGNVARWVAGELINRQAFTRSPRPKSATALSWAGFIPPGAQPHLDVSASATYLPQLRRPLQTTLLP